MIEVPEPLDALERNELERLCGELETAYAGYRSAGLALDLTRGKPGDSQLDLSVGLDGLLQDDFRAEDGTDTRNYGGLLGIPEARRLGAALLGVPADQVLAGGNSSLTLMYLYVETALLFGVRGAGTAWLEAGAAADKRPGAGRHEAPGGPNARSTGEDGATGPAATGPAATGPAATSRIKFLCPVPGYDRHFTVCKQLGIEMINIAMTEHGPDMDAVEAAVAADPLVKGIWCVPKYANPTGCIYSDAVIERFARLPERAGEHFRIFWDNAYAVHDLQPAPTPQANLLERAGAYGNADAVVAFASTSKITFAGSGVAFLASTPENLASLTERLGALMIGPNKVNQLRHARFLPDMDSLLAHMARHAALIRPKFDAVLERLDHELSGTGMGQWTRPQGGYFIAFDTLPGLAGEVVRLAGEAGVALTPAGATFPHGHDPNDTNIRLAPTYPSVDDVARATEVFATCVKLATVRQRLDRHGHH